MNTKWEIDHEGNRILANDARQTIICHMSASLKNPEVLKDARLIAAAPELLEAMEAAKKEMLELNEPCDHSVGICWCEYHRALDKIISAIDKARN